MADPLEMLLMLDPQKRVRPAKFNHSAGDALMAKAYFNVIIQPDKHTEPPPHTTPRVHWDVWETRSGESPTLEIEPGWSQCFSEHSQKHWDHIMKGVRFSFLNVFVTFHANSFSKRNHNQ